MTAIEELRNLRGALTFKNRATGELKVIPPTEAPTDTLKRALLELADRLDALEHNLSAMLPHLPTAPHPAGDQDVNAPRHGCERGTATRFQRPKGYQVPHELKVGPSGPGDAFPATTRTPATPGNPNDAR